MPHLRCIPLNPEDFMKILLFATNITNPDLEACLGPYQTYMMKFLHGVKYFRKKPACRCLIEP